LGTIPEGGHFGTRSKKNENSTKLLKKKGGAKGPIEENHNISRVTKENKFSAISKGDGHSLGNSSRKERQGIITAPRKKVRLYPDRG